MKRGLITAKVLLLAIAVPCLCSTSIFSGEHPWDGDGTVGTAGTTGDYQPGGGLTTTNPKGGSSTAQCAAMVRPMDPRGTLVFRLTMLTTKYFYGSRVEPQRSVEWNALTKRR